MIKITHQIAHDLMKLEVGVGVYCDQGAVVGDSEFIIFYPYGSCQPHLAHISEFETNGKDGMFIRPKEK